VGDRCSFMNINISQFHLYGYDQMSGGSLDCLVDGTGPIGFTSNVILLWTNPVSDINFKAKTTNKTNKDIAGICSQKVYTYLLELNLLFNFD
jgi:hypothetical protein